MATFEFIRGTIQHTTMGRVGDSNEPRSFLVKRAAQGEPRSVHALACQDLAKLEGRVTNAARPSQARAFADEVRVDAPRTSAFA